MSGMAPALSDPMAFRKRVWLKQFDYTGEHRYSFTICTWQRKMIFTTEEVVASVLSHFVQHAQRTDIAILAYCFMPDHLHLLAAGTSPVGDARRFIAAAKQATGYCFARDAGQRLWQRYSWDHVLRSDEETLAVMKYILANPVRAGLVASPLDYPFSGSCVYTKEALVNAFAVNTIDCQAG